MAERKIALIIAGGVSLGSYEGGVLTELLYQLDRYNRREQGNRYVVDVITGGSAGSITGGLTARIMMHGYERLRGILHELWVQDADVVKMLEHPSDNSLFAHLYQEELGRKFLDVTQDTSLEPANFAPDTLRLAFSLSNMVGVDYGFPYGLANTVQETTPANDTPKFLWTFFSDFFVTTVQRSTPPDVEIWNGIRHAAIASGGFPVAFAPSYVHRGWTDFPGAIEENSLPDSHAISDGGMFNNEPVGRAIQLAAKADGGLLSSDRVFILIDPNINTTKRDESYVNGAQTHGLLDNVKRLLIMALGEAEARDWLRAGKYNARLNWRDDLIDVFHEFVNALDAARLAERLQTAKEKNQKILRGMEQLGIQLDPGYLEDALGRIGEYHGEHVNKLGTSGDDAETKEARVDLFKRLVFSIDSTGSLTSKSPIELFVIGANKNDTAGEGFFSLAGFFEKHWREHDYRLGRRVAAELIPEFLRETYPGREPERDGEYDNDPDWGDLTKVRIGDADEARRKNFYDRIKEQLDRILKAKPWEWGWFKRNAAIYFVVGPFIKKQLGL